MYVGVVDDTTAGQRKRADHCDVVPSIGQFVEHRLIASYVTFQRQRHEHQNVRAVCCRQQQQQERRAYCRRHIGRPDTDRVLKWSVHWGQDRVPVLSDTSTPMRRRRSSGREGEINDARTESLILLSHNMYIILFKIDRFAYNAWTEPLLRTITITGLSLND